MPGDPLVHLDESTLIAFSQGKLRHRERVVVERHLDGCTDCLGRLEMSVARAKPDPFIKQLRSVAGRASTSDPTPWPASIDRLKLASFAKPRVEMLPGRRHTAFGVIHEAREATTGRELSVIFLTPDPARTPACWERLTACLGELRPLEHPNLVLPHGVELFSETWGIVTDRLPGLDFHALACAENRPKPPIACGLILQAATGLAHAHSQGIVHGNLQLDDLLLSPDGLVRVSGFLRSRLRFADRPSDPRDDVLALGRCLFALVTGRTPGRGLPAETLSRRITEQFTSLGLTEVIARMTEPDHQHVYATMDDVVEALTPFIGDGPVSRPDRPWRSLWRKIWGS